MCKTSYILRYEKHGYRPRRMKFPQELNGYVLKTKASHLDGGHRLWSGMERDGLRHATLPKTHHTKMTTATQSIPSRSSPGTRTTPSVAGHQVGGEKYATDGPKSLRARNNITIGTWNVRSLRAAGKVEKLTHEMKRYQWNILGLCEVRWKNFGETSTPEGHKLFFSSREDRHEHGIVIPHSQRHCECHYGMPTSLQPTPYHSPEGITV